MGQYEPLGDRSLPVSKPNAPVGEMGLGAGRSQSQELSHIGQHVQIVGDIEGGALQIEGSVTGDIRCDTVVLGGNGKVVGTIHAHRARVSGVLDGAIRTNDLTVEATARIKGDLSYARVSIASGAVIEGRLDPQRARELRDEKQSIRSGPLHPAHGLD